MDEKELRVDMLIAAGYQQVSRKYRRLARSTEKESNRFFSEDFVELSKEEFSIFQKKMGNTGWVPKGEQCPECLTLGHNHRKDCPNRK